MDETQKKQIYRNILIATDGPELASKAVDHGLLLAKGIGASVIFITVSEIWSPIDMAAEFRGEAETPMEKFEASAAKWAEQILTAAKAAAHDTGIECETIHVPDRAPAEGIIATANEKGCDLIIMASHGRRGLNRILLGSQTTEVLAYSKVSVLVLR